jgi:hypothetical protein
MSYRSNAVQTSSSSNNTSNDSWKAQGFLNLYLPSKDGAKRRKLGAIPLKSAKPSEKLMLDWLNEDPTRVAAIMAKLIIEFQPAQASESTGFDLS